MVSLPRSAVEALLEKNEASIKVYLYGLVRGEAEVAQISAELKLSQAQILEAFSLLEEAGLISLEAGSDRVRYLLGKEEAPLAADPYPDRGIQRDAAGAFFGSGAFLFGLQGVLRDFGGLRPFPASDFAAGGILHQHKPEG